MSGGWAPVSAVVDRADADREHRTDGFRAEELAAVAGGRLVHGSARRIRGGAVDSRRVGRDQAFIALAGARTDGHRFLGAAAQAGAAAVIVTRAPTPTELDELEAMDVAVIVVDDGIAALGAMAASWRDRFTPLMVAVTGSYAKTSTKEAAATVLAARLRTLKSEGNENNEIGLPLTLLRLSPEHEAAVVEMGMYVAGDIAALTAMAMPSIGVVTAVSGVHLERAGSLATIELEKGRLVEALPADGTAILNADDPSVRRMAARTRARVLTYGFAPDADVTATETVSLGAEGHAFPAPHAGRSSASRHLGVGPAGHPQRAGRCRRRPCRGSRARRHREGAGGRLRRATSDDDGRRRCLARPGRQLQRQPRVDDRGARRAGLDASTPGGRAGRDAGARAGRTRGPSTGRAACCRGSARC